MKPKIIYQFIIIIAILSTIAFILYNRYFSAENGQIYLEEGKYYRAADILCREIKIKETKLKISKIFHLKGTEAISSQINDLLLETAFCYFESGDIQKSLELYQNLYLNFSDNSNEALHNFIKRQIALCYCSLGYFNKAFPILKDLKSWYPQNLIAFYLNKEDFNNAKKILFSEDVQNKIYNGEDADAFSLIYLLREYYKQIGKYEKLNDKFSEELPKFEQELINKIHYADLYYRIGKYEKSEEIYSELIYNPEFSQKILNKMKLKYALVLAKDNKIDEAESVINEVLQTLEESYKYSPDIICSNYFLSKVSDKKEIEQETKKLYNKLNLTDESIFKNDIEYFCKVNIQY